MPITSRTLVGVATLLSFVAVAGSLAAEHLFGWRPCYLCIVQRFAYALVAVVGVVALAWGRVARGGALIMGGVSMLGGAAAAYQLVVQAGGPSSTCSGTEMRWLEQAVEFMAAHFGRFFEVTGFCDEAYRLLGVVPLVPFSLLLFGVITAGCWSRGLPKQKSMR